MPDFDLRRCTAILACALALAAAPAHASHDWMAAPPLPAVEGARLQLVPDATPAAIGLYRAPASDLLVTGYNQVGLASAFGVLGVLVASAANEAKAKDGIPGVAELPPLHLGDEARGLIDGPLAPAVSAARLAPAGGRSLEIAPIAMLSPAGDERFVPYVMLQVTLKDAAGAPLWTTRYTACTGSGRPLTGTGAWREGGGEAFRSSVHASLQAALQALLADLSHPREARPRTISLKTRLPFQQNKFKIDGVVLGVDDDYVAVLSDASDSAFGGVHVIDRHVAELGLPADLAAHARRADPAPAEGPRVTTRPADARHLAAADLEGHSWRYPHPRDPAKFGEIRLDFADGRVSASNAKGTTSGRFEVRDDMLCVDLESWGRICYYVLDRPAAAPQLLFVANSRLTPLRIDAGS